MESNSTPIHNQQNNTDQKPDVAMGEKSQKSPQRHREKPRAKEKTQVVSQSAALAPLLQELVKDMNTVIEENTRGMEDFLSTTSTNDQAQRLKIERERRKGVREKIDSLLASHGSKQQLKIPLWRHRMLGVQSPPPETILRVSTPSTCLDEVITSYCRPPLMHLHQPMPLVQGFTSSVAWHGPYVCCMLDHSYSHVGSA